MTVRDSCILLACVHIKNDISWAMETMAGLARILVWTGIFGMIALALDRALLAAEDRGWIYYRTRRPVRGVSMYHINELSEMLGGGSVPEIREEIQQAESGDPLGRRDSE